jgi:hypothetical protein
MLLHIVENGFPAISVTIKDCPIIIIWLKSFTIIFWC